MKRMEKYWFTFYLIHVNLILQLRDILLIFLDNIKIQLQVYIYDGLGMSSCFRFNKQKFPHLMHGCAFYILHAYYMHFYMPSYCVFHSNA